MSKKKPTAPIPLTGVVTITTDGRTTLAMKASHRGEDIEVLTGTANCRPGDVYSEYEGARIALARLYGLDPFPAGNDGAPKETGHWEAATKENCKVGSRVRVVNAKITFGHYDNGGIGVVDSFFTSSMVYIRFDGEEKRTAPACFLNELEVWIPGAESPADGKTMEQSEKNPFPPSFLVGDIVRLGDDAIFSKARRGCVARVDFLKNITTDDFVGVEYRLDVQGPDKHNLHQWCLETPDTKAPLELLYRDPEKGGEKA